jgi:hypothetical protein
MYGTFMLYLPLLSAALSSHTVTFDNLGHKRSCCEWRNRAWRQGSWYRQATFSWSSYEGCIGFTAYSSEAQRKKALAGDLDRQTADTNDMHIPTADNDGQDVPAPAVIPNNVADNLRRIRLRRTRNASRDNDATRSQINHVPRARTNGIASPNERQRKLGLMFFQSNSEQRGGWLSSWYSMLHRLHFCLNVPLTQSQEAQKSVPFRIVPILESIGEVKRRNWGSYVTKWDHRTQGYRKPD